MPFRQEIAPRLGEAVIVVGYPLVSVLGARPSVGDLPQNVNFAIRGEFVRNFLEANRIPFTASADSASLESTEIASRGAAVTVRVRCLREPGAVANPPSGQR